MSWGSGEQQSLQSPLWISEAKKSAVLVIYVTNLRRRRRVVRQLCDAVRSDYGRKTQARVDTAALLHRYRTLVERRHSHNSLLSSRIKPFVVQTL